MLAWRQQVDAGLEALLQDPPEGVDALVQLGLQHEQQHQELLLMDLLDGFNRQPLEPVYNPEAELTLTLEEEQWLACPGGLTEIGHQGERFHFDNETPRHRVWLEPFELSSSLVSNAGYADFIADGGYQRPELWRVKAGPWFNSTSGRRRATGGRTTTNSPWRAAAAATPRRRCVI